MLQQILNDLYIDPDLLAELDDEQKQTLFCKMREEQIRRWLIYEEQYEKNLLKHQKKQAKLGKQKQVRFLMGTDGNPWTWVMGEHPSDRTIEEIMVEEAKEKARILAEKETVELRKKENNNAVLSSSDNNSITSQEGDQKTEDDTVEERKREEWLQRKQQLLKVKNKSDGKFNDDSLVRIKEERTNEIFKNIQETQRKATELSEIIRRQEEEQWKERERKAKETEIQIREIARKAREEHKRMSDSNLFRLVSLPNADVTKENTVNRTKSVDFSVGRFKESEVSSSSQSDPTASLKQRRCAAFSINNRNRSRPSKPPSRNAIIEWFKNEEMLKDSGYDPETKEVADWFHGIISRTEAEELLASAEVGTFLVRVSERIWGYAISYKAAERCKHFLIDASSGEYQFFGNDHLNHQKLFDLVHYHKKVPITMNGQELLLHPCKQKGLIPDYIELFENSQK